MRAHDGKPKPLLMKQSPSQLLYIRPGHRVYPGEDILQGMDLVEKRLLSTKPGGDAMGILES
jgi:hypothetical protein